MPSVLDRPGEITLSEDLLGGFGEFPDRLFLISAGNDKYAANNVTLPDGQNVNGLACFPDEVEAEGYMAMLAGLNGEIVGRTFEEAREIAISKPVLSCLLLFQDGGIKDVHWVR